MTLSNTLLDVISCLFIYLYHQLVVRNHQWTWLHCARHSVNTTVKDDCSPRGFTTKAGSTLTKQKQEGCLPQHPPRVHLLPNAPGTALLLELGRCTEKGSASHRRALYHTTTPPINNPRSVCCHLLNTGTSEEALGCCRVTACLSPRGRTPTCHGSSPCRAMPRRLELTLDGMVGFLAVLSV